MVSRRIFRASAWGALAGAALLALGCGSGARDVVLVTAPGVRPDHMGLGGDTRLVETPAFDALAARGARFALCMTPVPETLPSAATILTGLYPSGHGLAAPDSALLNPSAKTLAELFRERGYRTAAFVSSSSVERRTGLDRGFDVYDDSFVFEPGASFEGFRSRRAEATLDAAQTWLAGESRRKPVFVWIQFADALLPYAPPPPFDEQYSTNPYDGEIAYVDGQLDRLERMLREEGLGDAILAVTSEHGQGLTEHFERGHGLFAFQSTLHVPLFIAGAGVSEGAVVAPPVRTFDIAPTLLALAGGDFEPYAGFHGESLAPDIAAPAAARGREMLIQNYTPALRFGWRPLLGIAAPATGGPDGTDRAWKYLTEPHEALYDLARERPLEQHNVFFDQPRTADLVRQRFRDAEARHGFSGGRPAVPPEVEEAARRHGDPDVLALWAENDLWRSEPMATEFLNRWETLRHRVASNHPDAMRDLESLLTQRPHNPAVAALAVEELLKRNRIETAYGLAVRLVSMDPGSARAWDLLHQLYFRRNLFDEAEDCLSVARALDPRHPLYAYLLGNIRLEQKRHAEAAALYEEALALGGKRSHYYYNLAVAKEALGDKKAALPLYRTALLRWGGAGEFRDFIAAAVERMERETKK